MMRSATQLCDMLVPVYVPYRRIGSYTSRCRIDSIAYRTDHRLTQMRYIRDMQMETIRIGSNQDRMNAMMRVVLGMGGFIGTSEVLYRLSRPAPEKPSCTEHGIK